MTPVPSDAAKAPDAVSAGEPRRDLLKSAPAPEALGALRREKSKESPAAKLESAPAQAPLQLSLRGADVAGRLEVSDLAEAVRVLVNLATRHGGAVIGARDETDSTVVELVMPRAGYPAFSSDLSSIGRWNVEREARELDPQVRISIRLTRRS